MTTHRLLLLRHAEALAYGGTGDRSRRLSLRGRDQAVEVGFGLKNSGIELIRTSPAMRARQTAELLRLDCPIENSEVLYHDSPEAILASLVDVDDSVESVLLVGHAPSLPELARELADSSADPDALAVISSYFPTATLAGFEFDGSWAGLTHARLFLAQRTAN